MLSPSLNLDPKQMHPQCQNNPNKPLDGDKGTEGNNKVLCFKCKEIGHYPPKCLKRYNKANTRGSVKKDLNIITCRKYNQKGHLIRLKRIYNF
jgi:hypothetical protein